MVRRPGNRGVGHPGSSHGRDTPALLAVGRRLHPRGGDRHHSRLYHAIQADLPALAGQLGAAYAIPIIYVPALMITHFVALYLLVRHQHKAAEPLAAS
jgi:hypothetical protein